MYGRRNDGLKLAPDGRFAEPDREPTGQVGRVWRFFTRGVWEPDLTKLPWWKARLFKLARVAYLTAEGFVQDKCMFRASALTYITVLSIVPLLALAFSIARVLGVFQDLKGRVEEMIASLAPPAEGAEAASETAAAGGGEGLKSALEGVLGLVEKTDLAGMNAVALIVLVYTVIKLLTTIEKSFNDIWGVHRARTWIRRIADYLTLVAVAPALILAANFLIALAKSNAVITWLKENHPATAELIEVAMKGLPLVVMWFGFAFAYIVMPNTRTRAMSALFGGIVGGTLWVLLQVLHVRFQLFFANHNALYATFAAFPIFLVWLYMSWVTMLLGAEVAYAHQSEPDYRSVALTRSTDHAFRELVALRAMTRIARVFLSGATPMREVEIAQELKVPGRTLGQAIGPLIDAGLLAEVETDRGACLLPARDLETIRVKSVLDALRGTSGPVDVPARNAADHRIDGVLVKLNDQLESSPANLSLRELALTPEESPRAAGDEAGSGAELGLEPS